MSIKSIYRLYMVERKRKQEIRKKGGGAVSDNQPCLIIKMIINNFDIKIKKKTKILKSNIYFTLILVVFKYKKFRLPKLIKN